MKTQQASDIQMYIDSRTGQFTMTSGTRPLIPSGPSASNDRKGFSFSLSNSDQSPKQGVNGIGDKERQR